MTLVQLRHFVALAELRSFSRAADKLYLTQPALSRSIRALEDELGGALFDRIGRSSELTPLGREMLVRARRILLDAGDMLDHGKALQGGVFGSIRIGLGAGPGALLAEPLLRHFAQTNRATRLTLARGAPPMLLQELQALKLDIIVVEISTLPAGIDVEVEPLSPLQPAFMCRPGHPLLKLGEAVSIADLLDYPVASPTLAEHITRQLVERYGIQAHPDQLVNMQSEDIRPLIAVAAHTDVVVLLSMRAAAPELVELPLRPRLVPARFVIAGMRGRTESRALRQAKEIIRRTIHD